MTTRQYISAALLSGAMFMCGFGAHAAYASTEAKAVWEYLCEQDTTGYVADCLSGCDAYTEWMESY